MLVATQGYLAAPDSATEYKSVDPDYLMPNRFLPTDGGTLVLGFLSPVCRFYIPPEHGNSHFFSASAAECATVSGRTGTDPNYSGYVLETNQAFAVALPDATGACPHNWLPVYRLWNNRPDSNHRYTTDPAIKAQMIANGYIPEGCGPDAVAMGSPTTD